MEPLPLTSSPTREGARGEAKLQFSNFMYRRSALLVKNLHCFFEKCVFLTILL